MLVVAGALPASAQIFKLAPCEAKKKFDAMPVPATQGVAMVVGHEFRKADVCVPVELRMTWKDSHTPFDHNWYEMSGREAYPGEAWYRTDRDEFVIVATGLGYSGNDRLLSFSAKGEACNHSYDQTCDMWTPFGPNDVRPSLEGASKTGAFTYGFPPVVSADDDGPPHEVEILPPHFEFRRNPREYSRPPMIEINNPALFGDHPITTQEVRRAVTSKGTIRREIRWEGNEKLGEGATRHKGSLDIEIAFAPTCPQGLAIVAPEPGARILFSEATPGVAKIELEAGGLPPELAERIVWSAPEKAGSELTFDPPTRMGKRMRVTYTRLPQSNGSFGATAITATLETDTCGTLTATREVRLYFPRDARNNPTGNVPNYYYYWLQTPAGQGLIDGQTVRYMHRQLECGENPKWLGYHPRDTRLSVPTDPMSQPLLVGRDLIFACDFHKYDDIYPGHPSKNFYMEPKLATGITWEGIDTFAVILRHEKAHMEHWRDWWNPTGGYPKGGYYDANNNKHRDPNEPVRDGDEDFIPDAREAALGYDPQEKNTMAIPGDDMFDEHHLTYDIGEKWPRGSANAQDWAKPGMQWQ